MSCLFCRIIKGDIPCHKVYEDDSALAFLDITPCSRGHTVIIPKKHYDSFQDMEDDDIAGLFSAVAKITAAVNKVIGTDASNIGLNNGKAAGQAVPHVHVHIIPRTDEDGGGSMHSIVKTEVDEDELPDLAKDIGKKV